MHLRYTYFAECKFYLNQKNAYNPQKKKKLREKSKERKPNYTYQLYFTRENKVVDIFSPLRINKNKHRWK